MNNFGDVVDEIGFRDLTFEGYEFTYDNGQDGENNRQCRLDRAMIIEGWLNMFPYARLIHLYREWSDHAPIKMVLDGRTGNAEFTGNRYRFEQIWVGEEGCEEAIRKEWGLCEAKIVDTISNCAKELQEWKGVSIGNFFRDLNKKRNCLKQLNEGVRARHLAMERRRIAKDIAHLLKEEEIC
ncbi:uncharacterized protein LOC141613047 [Silene latifolia]|uniref:uncharacterized protein LOC141613047 n=1 Tax=Silene latifolia TaxID=37657 RepID=UPI003D77181D